MEVLLALVVVLAAAGFAVLLVLAFPVVLWALKTLSQTVMDLRRRRRELRETFAEDHGLRVERRGRRLVGRRHNCTVVLEVTRDNNDNTHTRLRFEGLPRNLAISRRGTSFLPNLSGVDARSGDLELDRRVRLRGDASLLLAMLDHDTRLYLHELLFRQRRDLVLEDGVLTLTMKGVPRTRKQLDTLWQIGEELVPRLLQPRDVYGGLVERARHDPLPGVRARAVVTLMSRTEPDAREVVRGALDDADATVRLEAAVQLAHGATLHTLLLRDELEGEDELRAARALVRTPEWEGALTSLVPELVARLAADPWDKHTHEHNAKLARLLAAQLGRAPEALGEPLLLGMLALPSHKVRLDVVRALGAVGGVASTARLHEMIEAGSTFSGLTGTARQSLAAILARVRGEGAEAGALSILQPGEEGALSLTEELSSERRGGRRQPQES